MSLGACVGEAPTTSGGGHPDARPQGHDAMLLADARMADAGPFLCRDKITSGLESGHHNPGQDCQSNCHQHGFYMSGTLYSSANGGAPLAGASLTYIDANGETGDMHSNTNGNFWWSLPVAFPVTIIASACPDMKPMVAKVAASGAGCNQSGCHAGAGTPGRVHLP